jgi:hypothetical protein
MPLHRLLYTSEARLSDNASEAEHMVESIVAHSQANNEKRGLTGALLYVRGTFIQALEGPLDALENTFERICHDFRHARLMLVDMSPANERMFERWSMTYLAQNDEPARLRVNRDLEELYFTVNTNAAEAMRQMRGLLLGEGTKPALEVV